MRVSYALVLLCTAASLHCSSAASLTTAAATTEQSSHSRQDESILSWVHHYRVGDVIFAKPDDIKQLSSFVAVKSSQDDGTACFGSLSTLETENGPLQEIGASSARLRRDTSTPVQYECMKKVNSIYYYPEYAVGLLDNGCTAFLIGPYHAMTLAKCVYNHNERLWEKNLNFWRGRNDSGYLQRMEWVDVYIPRLFFEEGRERHDWAIISFDKSQSSSVWHSIEYCPDKCPGPYITTYGYSSSRQQKMLQKECEINEQDCSKHLVMDCCHSQSVAFHGGPVINGYRLDGSKMPPVVGVTAKVKHSADGKLVESAVTFDSDMFWSTCFLLSKSGYEPECKKV